MTAYSPLGNTNPTYASTSEAEEVGPLVDHASIQSIATARECTPAQVLLAWGLKRGTSVIPKSTNKAHIEQNLAADPARCIADADIQTLAAALPVKRFNNPSKSWGVALFEGLDGVPVELQEAVGDESVLEKAEELVEGVAKWGMMEMWAGVKGTWSFAIDMIGDDGF